MKSLIIYPGTFNPLHGGHIAIALWAQNYYTPPAANDKVDRYLLPVYFDVARGAYDKDPYVDELQFERSCQAIQDLGRSVWCSGKRSFLKKEWYYRRQVDTWWTKYYIYFLVGIDTAERIDNPKYYCDNVEERDLSLNSLHDRTKFVVFGRGSKEYDKDNFSPAFQAHAIKAEGFVPVDISSSEIRSRSE
jgi:nicotinic acid mononucleotide adenylyltransferase